MFRALTKFLTGTDNAGKPPELGGVDALFTRGFQSKDFPGVSPFTRQGSFWFRPGWVNPQPHVAGVAFNFMKPLEAGLLRLNALRVAYPNQVGRGVNSDAQTPLVRKNTFPVIQS